MAESLKTFFSPELVRRLAADIARVEPAFPARPFIARASAGLEDLELLDRGKHIAAALAEHLPPAYPEAIDVLLRSLGPEHATDELVGAGMAPFFYLPHVLFVAERGLDHFDLSMRAQYELTKRFSAEGSIRPYIAKDPERTLAVLREWARDENAHVRRLVSEGTRLRLPWAMRVAWLDRNPDRVIDLLELLEDDATTLVRRSVANNLNDLGKVHPKLLVETCGTWLHDASAERRALVEHALRSAVKRGEAGALATGRPPRPLREGARRRLTEGVQAETRPLARPRARGAGNEDLPGRPHDPQAAAGPTRGRGGRERGGAERRGVHRRGSGSLSTADARFRGRVPGQLRPHRAAKRGLHARRRTRYLPGWTMTTPSDARLVSDIMTRSVVTLFEEDDLSRIAEAMERFHFRHIPVVDDKKLVGLVTHRDLIRLSSSHLDPTRRTRDESVLRNLFVRDVMTTEVTRIAPEAPVVEAARLMRDGKFGCLPVTDATGELLGIVTETDLLTLLVTMLEASG